MCVHEPETNVSKPSEKLDTNMCVREKRVHKSRALEKPTCSVIADNTVGRQCARDNKPNDSIIWYNV